SIGKRYARMDEAGCPYCFTIDGETASSQSVTVRDRDTGGQERLALDRVADRKLRLDPGSDPGWPKVDEVCAMTHENDAVVATRIVQPVLHHAGRERYVIR